MRARVIVVAGSLIMALGCRASGGAAPGVESAVPCSATVPDVDVSGWRQVPAQGFTFCLPTDWRGGARAWRSDNARLEWSVGPSAGRVPFSVSRAGGANIDRREYNEAIGGRSARLLRFRNGTDFVVNAEWTDAAINFTGVAPTLASADLLLAIYRTVRFSS